MTLFNRKSPKLILIFCLGFSFSACAVFSTRPVQHLSYAESAFQGATIAGAETVQPALYQLAKDALLRARSAYRLKDFKSARSLAIRARRLSEEAEWKTKQAELANGAGPKEAIEGEPKK